MPDEVFSTWTRATAGLFNSVELVKGQMLSEINSCNSPDVLCGGLDAGEAAGIADALSLEYQDECVRGFISINGVGTTDDGIKDCAAERAEWLVNQQKPKPKS